MQKVAGTYFRGLRPGKSQPTSRQRRRGGLDPADCAGVGFGAIRAGGLLCPWRPLPLEVVKLWQARTFEAAELVPSMTVKSYWVRQP